MAINLLSALGSVSGSMYSKRMATRAQKNFESQLSLKRELETRKLNLAERKQNALEEQNKILAEIEKYKSITERKKANAYTREARLKENKWKNSIANNVTNNMKEGEN